jgi:Transglycosylase SLT domain
MKLWRNFASLAFLLTVCASACSAGETATLRNGFTIHYQRRELRGDVARLYILESADSFVDVPADDILEVETDGAPPATPGVAPQTGRPAHPINLEEALSAASHHYNVSPDLLRSVIRAESGFNPNARSVKGAQGLMQLMPETAARLGVRNAMDPEENLEGGARFLRELLGRYNNNITLALAAYNAGPERVEQYHGVPPYPETIAYVIRVLRGLDREKSPGHQLTAMKSIRHRTLDEYKTTGLKPSVMLPGEASALDSSTTGTAQTGDSE